MTVTPLKLAPKPPVDKTDALRVIDSLRKSVEEGEIKFFVCVGIDEEHSSFVWQAKTTQTTVLEALGAIEWLRHCTITDNNS